MKFLQRSLDNGLIGLLTKTLFYSALLIFFIWSGNYCLRFLFDILLTIGDIPDEEAVLLLPLVHKWQLLLQHNNYLVIPLIGLLTPYFIGLVWAIRQLIISYKLILELLNDDTMV